MSWQTWPLYSLPTCDDDGGDDGRYSISDYWEDKRGDDVKMMSVKIMIMMISIQTYCKPLNEYRDEYNDDEDIKR